jgi:hypothetical protein
MGGPPVTRAQIAALEQPPAWPPALAAVPTSAAAAPRAGTVPEPQSTPSNEPEHQLPSDPSTLLRELRRDFPHFGILYDGKGTWTAVYGPLAPFRSRSALGLRAVLDTVTAPTSISPDRRRTSRARDRPPPHRSRHQASPPA